MGSRVCDPANAVPRGCPTHGAQGCVRTPHAYPRACTSCAHTCCGHRRESSSSIGFDRDACASESQHLRAIVPRACRRRSLSDRDAVEEARRLPAAPGVWHQPFHPMECGHQGGAFVSCPLRECVHDHPGAGRSDEGGARLWRKWGGGRRGGHRHHVRRRRHLAAICCHLCANCRRRVPRAAAAPRPPPPLCTPANTMAHIAFARQYHRSHRLCTWAQDGGYGHSGPSRYIWCQGAGGGGRLGPAMGDGRWSRLR